MAMILMSPHFQHQATIPREFTCQGANHSPALKWEGEPENTKSFVLIVDDPDAPDPKAPKMTWVHWVMYNLPPTTHSLAKGIDSLPKGTAQGLNDWKKTGYGGPCPPVGKHRYFHKLYALDVVLPELKTPSKDELQKAMKGHVLAEAQLMGTYKKD